VDSVLRGPASTVPLWTGWGQQGKETAQSSGTCSGPARTCSCDVYAVCHREYQEGDPLSYCGIRDLWSVQREGIAGCAYSSAANKMATICHRHADMNEPVDVVVVVIWDLLAGDETMSLTRNFACDPVLRVQSGRR
jgi:hypothetical protein